MTCIAAPGAVELRSAESRADERVSAFGWSLPAIGNISENWIV
jgi:hypothetical protein